MNNTNSNTKAGTLILETNRKINYAVGEEFKRPSVVLVYEDGRQEDVSNSEYLTFSGYDLTKEGLYKVNVLFKNKEIQVNTNYYINVHSNEIVSLSVEVKDNNLVWGKEIDHNNLVVKAIYSDKTSEIVTNYELSYNNEPVEYGEIIVRLTYHDLSSTFKINVISDELDKKYQSIESEAVRILILLGKSDPKYPRDYEINNSVNHTFIKFSGEFDVKVESYETLAAYIITIILPNYSLDGEIVDSSETGLPSKKAVFINVTESLKTTVYLTQVFGKMHYIFNVEELK